MTLTNYNFDELRKLSIGTVESVSPFEIRILLDIDAPQNTSLNTGEPTLFPKINGYVLIPNEAGALICIISWMGVEHSSYPKRRGFKDFDLIDLPFPLRKMIVNPLGIIKKESDQGYKIDRGVYSYPSVGDIVAIPTRKQLESIVENKDKNSCIKIGVSPLAANSPVFVDPDKLFGRHIAILGNTGSGKSCSVAGLIRWSLEEAKKDIVDENKKPNARFIILDPNGEYSYAFDDILSNVRKYKVSIDDKEKSKQIQVPAWLWNSHEWCSFSRAAPGIQRPLLIDALSLLRRGESATENFLIQLFNFITGYLSFYKSILALPLCNMQPKDYFRCRDAFEHFLIDINRYLNIFDDKINKTILELIQKVKKFYYSNSRDSNGIRYFNGCTETDLSILIKDFEEFLKLYFNQTTTSDITSDTPVEFSIEQLPSVIESLANIQGGTFPQMANTLILRIKSLLEDARVHDILSPKEEKIDLLTWLTKYIAAKNTSLTIIDFSLVPNEIIHLLVSVISRLTLESLQRYRKLYGKVLPTVLVLEEAHNFINRYNTESDDLSPAVLCSQTFEKIAKEGRKFGLGLVISSQRPSELSPTILSQCNTFLLHRLVNDRDQELVRKLVPDNLGKLLNELPTLPTRKAILLGWAATIPVLVEMNEINENQRPQSSDPDFWDVWTHKKERIINWDGIVKEWQKSKVEKEK